jgi:hypothetical protein
MQRLEVSGAVRPLYGSLGVKGLKIVGVVTEWRTWPPRYEFVYDLQLNTKKKTVG